MTVQVLNSLWNKICNVFATKSELSDIVANKQDRLTAGIGIRIEGNTIINQAIPTTDKEEIVQVAITFDSQESLPNGFDITEDLPITVFCNNESEPFGTYNLDEYGMCSFTIPYGYRYRIEFSTIQGYNPIPDEEHIATVIERSVEKQYITVSSEEDHSGQEFVEVIVQQKSGNSYTKLADIELQVEINGGNPITYTTDANGKFVFYVDQGLQYLVTAPEREDCYFSGFNRTQIYTADSAQRVIIFEYRLYSSGLTIMNSNGDDYTLEEWKEMIENEEVTNEEAKYIKISSTNLINNQGVFCVDIDMVRERTQGSNTSWANSNVQFNSIPLNGNSVNELYYYDGLTASRLIQQEGDDRSIPTAAVDRCLDMSRVVAESTANEKTMPGFLGSTGQWIVLWNNVAEMDDILRFVRPNGTYLMSAWTTQKWTSTQSSAPNAYNQTNVVSSGFKNVSYVVLPFFAC